jgi:hypothetical protein
MTGSTREERHWKALRRALLGTLIGFSSAGLIFLGNYLGWPLLRLAGFVGFVASFCWLIVIHAELFQIWFVRGKKR